MTLPNEPLTRQEMYLSKIAGEDTELPAEPLTREEMYLDEIARNGGGGGGGGVTPEQLDERVKLNAGAPTTATVGTVGQLIEDTTNGALYQLISIDSGATLDTSAGLTSQMTGVTFSITNATTFNTAIAPFKLAAGNYMIRRNIGNNAYYVSTATSDTSLGVITGVSVYAIQNGLGVAPNPVATFNQLIGSMAAKAPIFSFTMKAGSPVYNWENVKSTVVQTIGNSESSVMSQKAVTDTIFYNNNNKVIAITPYDTYHNGGNFSVMLNGTVDNGSTYSFAACGARAYNNYGIGIGMYASPGENGIALGYLSKGEGTGNIALGISAEGNYKSYAIALGAYSKPTRDGEVNIGLVNGMNTSGYNNSAYRLIGGVYPGVDNHDAATVSQLSDLIGVINSVLNTNIVITNGVITDGNNANNNADEPGIPDDIDPDDPSDPSDPSDPGEEPGPDEPAPDDAEAPGP